MISAKEAKELTENTKKYVEKLLDELEEVIYATIRKNKYGFEWVIDEKKYPFAADYAVKELKELGYKVRMTKFDEEIWNNKKYHGASIEIRWD